MRSQRCAGTAAAARRKVTKRRWSADNPLERVQEGRLQKHQRRSRDLIYESVMRGGGEPFGAPFALGIQSLTEKIVSLFRVKGFFGFESMERLRPRNRRNKFTRHGASRFRGPFRGQGQS